MRTVLKHIVASTYKPLLVKYLSKKRIYHYKGLRLEIPPEVFHPGFFSSTQLLLKYVMGLQPDGKAILELGAGSGLIAMMAARKGAAVTASDINPVAVEYLQKNSYRNKLSLTIIHSDLFENIPQQFFDIIAVNPPYYKKDPVYPAEYAWYCGANGEYFQKLFEGLAAYANYPCTIIMTLCDGCDLSLITNLAAVNGFRLSLRQTKQQILEKNFVYEIERKL